MINLSFATAKDLQEAAVIERRRKTEEERKQRIFNARTRIIGVDKQALNEQVDEKQRILQKQREIEINFAREQERQRIVALKKEQQLCLESQLIKKQIDDFRLKVQKPEYRRDYDLYDPLAKLKELPARISDTDPRLTVSSAQIFDGEDLTMRDRRRVQMEQQRAWLEQQIAERKLAEENRKKAEMIEYEATMARERRALELQEQERRAKNQLYAATVQYNRALASEQKHHTQIKKREEEEDNLAEQINHITSEMLTESTDAVASTFGPHRIVPYTYRRMPAAVCKEIVDERERQCLELQQKRVNCQSVDQKWEELAENFDKVMMAKESEVNAMNNAKLSGVIRLNKQLADEQKRNNEFIEKVVYTNPPTMAYFEQFNTTSR